MPLLRKEQITLLSANWSSYTYTVATGSTTTILPGGFQAETVTKTSGGNADTLPAVRGIITSGLGGMVKFRRTDTGAGLEDTGAPIFGRLTYSGGNYLVTYRKYNGGIETGATVSGTGSLVVEMLFQEVMQFSEIPANANTLYGTVTEISTSGSGGGVSTIIGSGPIHSSGLGTVTLSIDNVTTSAAGAMSAADKVILDAATESNTASTIVKRSAAGAINSTTLNATTGNVTNVVSTNVTATSVDATTATASNVTSHSSEDLFLQRAGVSKVALTTTGAVIQSGSTLSTAGTGNLNLPNNASARFNIEGVAVTSAVTASNLGALTNGSNADALHTHIGLSANPGNLTVRVATKELSNLFGTASLIDGVSVNVNDRVLVKNQTNRTQNGIYVVTAGAWTRAADSLIPGLIYSVTEGTLNRGSIFKINNIGTITIGVTDIGFTKQNIINVLDFGAYNTGLVSDATANVTAIRAALAASNGIDSIVFFPAGSYYINDMIDISTKRIVGEFSSERNSSVFIRLDPGIAAPIRSMLYASNGSTMLVQGFILHCNFMAYRGMDMNLSIGDFKSIQVWNARLDGFYFYTSIGYHENLATVGTLMRHSFIWVASNGGVVKNVYPIQSAKGCIKPNSYGLKISSAAQPIPGYGSGSIFADNIDIEGAVGGGLLTDCTASNTILSTFHTEIGDGFTPNGCIDNFVIQNSSGVTCRDGVLLNNSGIKSNVFQFRGLGNAPTQLNGTNTKIAQKIQVTRPELVSGVLIKTQTVSSPNVDVGIYPDLNGSPDTVPVENLTAVSQTFTSNKFNVVNFVAPTELPLAGASINRTNNTTPPLNGTTGVTVTGQTGTTATFSSLVGTNMTLTGLTGMSVNSVGRYLTITNAATSANNGTFLINQYNSATSVRITNANGGATAADANNGLIGWTEKNTGMKIAQKFNNLTARTVSGFTCKQARNLDTGVWNVSIQTDSAGEPSGSLADPAFSYNNFSFMFAEEQYTLFPSEATLGTGNFWLVFEWVSGNTYFDVCNENATVNLMIHNGSSWVTPLEYSAGDSLAPYYIPSNIIFAIQSPYWLVVTRNSGTGNLDGYYAEGNLDGYVSGGSVSTIDGVANCVSFGRYPGYNDQVKYYNGSWNAETNVDNIYCNIGDYCRNIIVDNSILTNIERIMIGDSDSADNTYNGINIINGSKFTRVSKCETYSLSPHPLAVFDDGFQTDNKNQYSGSGTILPRTLFSGSSVGTNTSVLNAVTTKVAQKFNVREPGLIKYISFSTGSSWSNLIVNVKVYTDDGSGSPSSTLANVFTSKNNIVTTGVSASQTAIFDTQTTLATGVYWLVLEWVSGSGNIVGSITSGSQASIITADQVKEYNGAWVLATPDNLAMIIGVYPGWKQGSLFFNSNPTPGKGAFSIATANSSTSNNWLPVYVQDAPQVTTLLGTAVPSQSGAAATFSSLSGNVLTITGLTGMVSGSVGRLLTISGAATTANNGTYFISAFVSSTSVRVIQPNTAASATDANNGSLVWSERSAVTLDVTTSETYRFNNTTPYVISGLSGGHPGKQVTLLVENLGLSGFISIAHNQFGSTTDNNIVLQGGSSTGGTGGFCDLGAQDSITLKRVDMGSYVQWVEVSRSIKKSYFPAITAPATNITSGAQVYSDTTGLKAKNQNGLITTLSPVSVSTGTTKLIDKVVNITTTTSNGSANTTYALLDASVTTIEVTATAKDVSAGSIGSIIKRASYKRHAGGTATLVGSVTLVDFQADAALTGATPTALSAASLTLTTTGNSALATVTGASGINLTWMVVMEVKSSLVP